jgi:hypothetical protein
MDELKKKAQEAVDDKIYNKDIKAYIKERWSDLKPKEVHFLMYLMKGYPGWKSYMMAQGTETSIEAAKVQAYRWTRKLDVSFDELLEFSGHGTDQIAEALTNLKAKDEDAYLRHIIKLKKLDVQKIEHSGQIGTYQIEFTDEPVEDEDEE